MKRLFILAACAFVFAGCADMPERTSSSQQTSEKRFTEEDDYVTGSRIARKPQKNTAPESGASSTQNSPTR